MQHGCLFFNQTQVIRFIQASLAAGGTVQISLKREHWVVYVSLTETNGPDVEIVNLSRHKFINKIKNKFKLIEKGWATLA